MICDGRPISRNGGKRTKSEATPIARSKDHGDHARFACFVSLDCPLHLDVVTIVRSYEIAAYEKQNDVGLFELIADLVMNVVTSEDASIVPSINYALTL